MFITITRVIRGAKATTYHQCFRSISSSGISLNFCNLQFELLLLTEEETEMSLPGWPTMIENTIGIFLYIVSKCNYCVRGGHFRQECWYLWQLMRAGDYIVKC